MRLKTHYHEGLLEAGCDEAGRGCLAGSVYAAAVILPPGYDNPALDDSKKLSEKKRFMLRDVIMNDAAAWALGVVTAEEIDNLNILRASILAMHRALDALAVRPEAVVVDGNCFTPYHNLSFATVVKGDGKYQSVAAASILAKTFRDEYMNRIAEEYPFYEWQSNKGYPTTSHREGLRRHGVSPYHRRSFNLLGGEEATIDFGE